MNALAAILRAPWRQTRGRGPTIKSTDLRVKLDPVAALQVNAAALRLRVPVAELVRRACVVAVAIVEDGEPAE